MLGWVRSGHRRSGRISSKFILICDVALHSIEAGQFGSGHIFSKICATLGQSLIKANLVVSGPEIGPVDTFRSWYQYGYLLVLIWLNADMVVTSLRLPLLHVLLWGQNYAEVGVAKSRVGMSEKKQFFRYIYIYNFKKIKLFYDHKNYLLLCKIWNYGI